MSDEQSNIIVSEGPSLTVDAGTKILFTDALTFQQDGHTFSLSFEVDFKDLPPPLHALAIQIIQQSVYRHVCIPSRFYTPKEKPQKKSFWKKLFG